MRDYSLNCDDKYNKLQEYLRNLNRVAVAFSGGVDSTFLLKVVHDILGEDVIAITAKSVTFSKREQNEAKQFCNKEGIKQIWVNHDVMQIPEYYCNDKNRCYYCKKALFHNLKQVAFDNNISNVLDGTNMDDTKDYRPGMKALEELSIISPLREVGLTKQEIRELSHKLNLSTWDKSAFACLASRIPYGEEITKEKLNRIDDAEAILYDLGFHQFRVRMHNDLARIEIDREQFDYIMREDIRNQIDGEFKRLGFTYVSLDLSGYSQGNMNKHIENRGNDL